MAKVLLQDARGEFHGREFHYLAGESIARPALVRHLEALGVPMVEKSEFLRQHLDSDIAEALEKLDAQEPPAEAVPEAKPAPKSKPKKS